MDIQLRDDGKKARFVIENEGIVVAETTYVWAGSNKIIIDHTLVDQSLQGRNVGKQLVHQAVLFAREKHIKIVPLCPFASAVFAQTTDYKDVLVH
jgi:predicted GNAT family acetyltransferase